MAMKSQTVPMLLVSLLLVGCGEKLPKPILEQAERVRQEARTEEQAIAEIEKLGGRVHVCTIDGIPYGILVNLNDTTVDDAGLVHLKGLTTVTDLSGCNQFCWSVS